MRRWVSVLTALLLLGLPRAVRAASVEDLIRAYPDALSGFDGVNLIWRDGTRMKVGPAQAGGSILDQLAATYPAGAPLSLPVGDPGRVRNRDFFDKMYGDCKLGQVAPNLVRILWLPKSWGHAISITSVNGVDRALEAVSRELDELPAADKRYLYPLGGTYNCRDVAGTDQFSMHAWAAAIDINPAFANYWRWSRQNDEPPAYRNRIPAEIVDIFERHGFIWGGRWSHFDTMHFEYRPELTTGSATRSLP